jgi:hypothetical protein
MANKEDYIILADVLRKMEFDCNYKATYPEETALYSVFDEKCHNEHEPVFIDGEHSSPAR